MEFDGTMNKLQPSDLAELAGTIGCTEAHLRTVIEVETSGKGYDSMREVSFLFETHKFYAALKGKQLQTAIQQGLAKPSWGGPGSYPKTPALRWAQFQKAVALNETAAISSASWGLGQIMGSEYDECGFSSPQEMLVAFYKSEYEQVKAMVSLIKHRGLDKDLRNFPDMAACRHFALRYNGKAYAKNNYHNKLHDSYVKWASRLGDKPMPKKEAEDSTLRVGDRDTIPKGGPIWQMQELFKSKGYSLLVDGNFGPGTRAVVLAWKGNQGMDPITPEMTVNDLALLIKSGPMPVAEERANATVEDLKPSSSIIQETSVGKKILGWTTGAVGVGQVADASGVLDTAQDGIEKAEKAKGVFSSAKYLLADSGVSQFIHFILEWKFPILCGVVVAGFIILNRVQKRRLEMHKNAEIG